MNEPIETTETTTLPTAEERRRALIARDRAREAARQEAESKMVKDFLLTPRGKQS